MKNNAEMIGTILGALLVVLLQITIPGIIVYLTYPYIITVIPGLVNTGFMVKSISLWDSICITFFFDALLFGLHKLTKAKQDNK
jgi:hypothetical protein